MTKLLFKEEKSISRDITRLAQDIEKCIIEDLPNIEERFNKYYQCLFKTNTFQLFFQDEYPFLRDVILEYVVYLVNDKEAYDFLTKKMHIDLNSSYDDLNNKLTIVTCFVNNKPITDFSESIIHEITHMYQYNIGMNKKRDLYNTMLNMLSNDTNIDRYYVALALYYTFPHEQDAFTHQFYKGEDGTVENFKPFKIFKKAFEIVKNNYMTNKEMQKAIHELGYSFKSYFKRLHFGLKRFEHKLLNVKTYWIKESLRSHGLTLDNRITELCNRTVWNKSYTTIAPFSTEDCYDKFLKSRKQSKLFEIVNKKKNDIMK